MYICEARDSFEWFFCLDYFKLNSVFRNTFNFRPWEADGAGSFEEAVRH